MPDFPVDHLQSLAGSLGRSSLAHSVTLRHCVPVGAWSKEYPQALPSNENLFARDYLIASLVIMGFRNLLNFYLISGNGIIAAILFLSVPQYPSRKSASWHSPWLAVWFIKLILVDWINFQSSLLISIISFDILSIHDIYKISCATTVFEPCLELKKLCENQMSTRNVKVYRNGKKLEPFSLINCHQSSFENVSFYSYRRWQSNDENCINFRNFSKSWLQFSSFFIKKSNKDVQYLLAMV